MMKNDYRRALIMLRPLDVSWSGHIRLERRTLIGSMQFTVFGAPAGERLLAVMIGGGRGGRLRAHPLGEMRNGGRGQAGFHSEFDPRDMGGLALEEYALAGVARLGGDGWELAMAGFPNGSREIDWAAAREAVRGLVDASRAPGAQAREEPAPAGTRAEPDPTPAGTRTEPDPTPAGTRTEPDPTPAGTRTEPDPTPAGTRTEPDPTPAGTRTEPDPTPAGTRAEPDPTPAGTRAEPDPTPTGTRAEPDLAPAETGREEPAPDEPENGPEAETPPDAGEAANENWPREIETPAEPESAPILQNPTYPEWSNPDGMDTPAGAVSEAASGFHVPDSMSPVEAAGPEPFDLPARESDEFDAPAGEWDGAGPSAAWEDEEQPPEDFDLAAERLYTQGDSPINAPSGEDFDRAAQARTQDLDPAAEEEAELRDRDEGNGPETGEAPGDTGETRGKTALDCLGLSADCPWPESLASLRDLFAASAPWPQPPEAGFVFVRADMPPGSGFAYTLTGLRAQDGRIDEVMYAVPAPASADPPPGLEDYAWKKGYWVYRHEAGV